MSSFSFKTQSAHDAVYTFYYTQAVDEGIEWTDEHDRFVDDVTSDFISYIRESAFTFFNAETPTLPGLETE